MIYLDEADDRVDSCILDMDENGEVFAEAASEEESPGSQVDSRLSLRPICSHDQVWIYAQTSNANLSTIGISHHKLSMKVRTASMLGIRSASCFLFYFVEWLFFLEKCSISVKLLRIMLRSVYSFPQWLKQVDQRISFVSLMALTWQLPILFLLWWTSVIPDNTDAIKLNQNFIAKLNLSFNGKR